MENRLIDIAVFAFVLLFIVPLVISAVLYVLGDPVKEWRSGAGFGAGLANMPPYLIGWRPVSALLRRRRSPEILGALHRRVDNLQRFQWFRSK
jgi:hypothetical protein